MELTKERLIDLREKAVAKRQEYLNMVYQANGAIDILNMLIEEASKQGASDAPNSDSHD